MRSRGRHYWSSYVSALAYRWTYTRLSHQLDDELFAWLGQRIRGAVVVDCGCGPGVVTAKLLQRGAASVVAVDVNASMLRQTRERLDAAAIKRAVLVHSVVDAAFWQRFQGSCDLVLWKRSLYAPRHEALATLRAARTRLAPGGALVVMHADRSLLRHCFGPRLRVEPYTAYHLFNRALSVAGARLGLGEYRLYSRKQLFDLLWEVADGAHVEAIPSAQRAFNLAAIVARC